MQCAPRRTKGRPPPSVGRKGQAKAVAAEGAEFGGDEMPGWWPGRAHTSPAGYGGLEWQLAERVSRRTQMVS